MNLFSKFFAAIFTVLFIWAASVQYNDPDAALWYVLYGIAALASVLFLFQKLPKLVGLLLAVSYGIGGILFWPEQYQGVAISGGNIDNIEHARESLGLFVNAIVILFYNWQISIQKKESL
ncbi:Transmembrane family 220, helix [Arenibacter nanhaiticus]|uniref:Transmembrane family 220, helix n=1 Tax=Arenibacter nanhaiticus TaxID=558155 RepID=A0A1M6B3B4_9FLAO|nr:transmembrane 220 family protein [Arenibacter nanhaiticus]SHI43234.1 Transmembrane family 220, helix [Arenibacter nanhaiticus]